MNLTILPPVRNTCLVRLGSSAFLWRIKTLISNLINSTQKIDIMSRSARAEWLINTYTMSWNPEFTENMEQRHENAVTEMQRAYSKKCITEETNILRRSPLDISLLLRKTHWFKLQIDIDSFCSSCHSINIGKLVGWLVFMAYQPLLVIYCQIHLYSNNQFYFK